jgi:glycosyltransferase involved in cell wall biosynthesis
VTRLRVGFDWTPAVAPHPTGVGQLVRGLAEALRPASTVELVRFCVSGRAHRAEHDGVASAPVPASIAHRLWQHLDRPRVERWTGPVDVLHATNFVAPPSRAPTVVSVYDLGFLRHPEWAGPGTTRFARLIGRAVQRGAVVHTLSSSVAAEIAARFDVPPERLVVIPPGVDPVIGDASRGRRLAGAASYVLALGTIEPRKNLPRLIEAFDGVAAATPELRLVVVGPDGWGLDAYDAAVRRARARDRIVRLGYVRAAERGDLTAGAAVLAYPSLDEGFGLPPLEAMTLGVPVVASRAAVLRDVLGDAALLVDPTDVAALGTALQRAVTDEPLRRHLTAAGPAHAAAYPWSRAAAAFLELYRSLVGPAAP